MAWGKSKTVRVQNTPAQNDRERTRDIANIITQLFTRYSAQVLNDNLLNQCAMQAEFIYKKASKISDELGVF